MRPVWVGSGSERRLSARHGRSKVQLDDVEIMAIRARAYLICLSFLLAFTLTVGSFFLQRNGPELIEFGNLCGSLPNELCYEPVLKGGFPIAYVFDAPGISVPRQLGPEDSFSLGAFALDLAIYFFLGLVAIGGVSHRGSKRKKVRC